jgi:hypothetical protein
MGITLRTGSIISQTVISTGDFILQAEHIRSMFHVAKDLRSKLLVSMAKDLGWRISDVLSIKRSELPDLEQETPIEWIRITQKEKQVSKTCLSTETATILKEYLFSFPTENPYLFNSNGKGAITPDTVNRRLKDLAQDADIKIGNSKLSFHCFRKTIISQAKNLGIDSDIIKLMVGKSVKKDMLTYMTGIDVKTAFNKLQTILGINLVTRPQADSETALKEQITQLENSVVNQQETIEDINNRLKLVVRRYVELRKHILNLDFQPLIKQAISQASDETIQKYVDKNKDYIKKLIESQKIKIVTKKGNKFLEWTE